MYKDKKRVIFYLKNDRINELKQMLLFFSPEYSNKLMQNVALNNAIPGELS